MPTKSLKYKSSQFSVLNKLTLNVRDIDWSVIKIGRSFGRIGHWIGRMVTQRAPPVMYIKKY